MRGYRVRTTKCRGALSHIRADKIFFRKKLKTLSFSHRILYSSNYCYYTGFHDLAYSVYEGV